MTSNAGGSDQIVNKELSTRVQFFPTLLRFILASILISAATLKAYQLLAIQIDGTSAALLHWPIASAELILGTWLITGCFSGWAWLLSLIAFSGFTCFILVVLIRGNSSCGCFGFVTISPWKVLVVDIGVVLALLKWRFGRLTIRGPFIVTSLCFSISIASFIGWEFSSDLSLSTFTLAQRVFVFEPDEWVGKKITVLQFIDIGNELANGRWKVLLYRSDCARCQHMLSSYKERGRLLANGNESSERVAIVDLSSAADESAKDAVLSGNLIQSAPYLFVSTPVELSLRDGILERSEKQ